MVNSCHHQIIGRLGTGLEVLQRAEDGVVEAFRHKTLPVWGIQWHPERLTADCKRARWTDWRYTGRFYLRQPCKSSAC